MYRESLKSKTLRIFATLLPLLSPFVGCSSAPTSSAPISNPFFSNSHPANGPSQNLVLRTKKGDRSVELEMPGDQETLSDFVLPVSPAFKKDSNPESSMGASTGIDESYQGHAPTLTDREIARAMPQGSPEDETRRSEIETSLNLVPVEGEDLPSNLPSYLAKVDRIKQLYKIGRFEAALVEVDEGISRFQMDARLHEMRGTLLDRLGKEDLALKSWNQALHLNPNNKSLRKYVERRTALRGRTGP